MLQYNFECQLVIKQQLLEVPIKMAHPLFLID